MEKLDILNTRERKEIEKAIRREWGCKYKFTHAVFLSSNNKLYILNKDVARIHTEQLRIDSLGFYFGEWKHNQLRLSFDASQMIGPLAEKNVLWLSDEQADAWMSGKDIEIAHKDAWVIVQNRGDYLGCGRVKDNVLLNYVPKERRH